MGENMKTNIQVGKAYKIEDLLELLEKSPDISLGHIVVAGVHKYYQDKMSLESILLAATKGIEKGYKIPTIYVTVLNITDPFERYRRFKPFYDSIEKDILFAIGQSVHKEIAVAMTGVIDEAKGLGYNDIEKTDQLADLLAGLNIYFRRKDITVGTIGEEYITFKKM